MKAVIKTSDQNQAFSHNSRESILVRWTNTCTRLYIWTEISMKRENRLYSIQRQTFADRGKVIPGTLYQRLSSQRVSAGRKSQNRRIKKSVGMTEKKTIKEVNLF